MSGQARAGWLGTSGGRRCTRMAAALSGLIVVAACGMEPAPGARGDTGEPPPAGLAAPASPGRASPPAPASPRPASPAPTPLDTADAAEAEAAPPEPPAARTWETVPPGEAGFHADVEDRIEAALADYPGVTAVVVARGGRIAVELARGRATHHNVYSVTKSVIGTLAGIAVGDGAIGLDTRVADVLGEQVPTGADGRVADLTVEDLLTMTAGLPGDLALPPPPPDGDWVAHALAQPLGPAGRFVYSSTTSHVLGAMVAEATGSDLLTYARERLFDPLGIDTSGAYTPALTGVFPSGTELGPYTGAGFAWPTDPDGLHLGYCCLKLTARDMLALGQLWLQEGRWDGRQLVGADFVARATTPDGDGYGYHWWVTREDGRRAFYAAGLGGQVVEVVPELDLVVVIASSDLTGTGSRALVGDVIIPALE